MILKPAGEATSHGFFSLIEACKPYGRQSAPTVLVHWCSLCELPDFQGERKESASSRQANDKVYVLFQDWLCLGGDHWFYSATSAKKVGKTIASLADEVATNVCPFNEGGERQGRRDYKNLKQEWLLTFWFRSVFVSLSFDGSGTLMKIDMNRVLSLCYASDLCFFCPGTPIFPSHPLGCLELEAVFLFQGRTFFLFFVLCFYFCFVLNLFSLFLICWFVFQSSAVSLSRPLHPPFLCIFFFFFFFYILRKIHYM